MTHDDPVTDDLKREATALRRILDAMGATLDDAQDELARSHWLTDSDHIAELAAHLDDLADDLRRARDHVDDAIDADHAREERAVDAAIAARNARGTVANAHGTVMPASGVAPICAECDAEAPDPHATDCTLAPILTERDPATGAHIVPLPRRR